MIERQEIINLTKRMVEVPSVSGRLAESTEVLNIVSEYLEQVPGLVSRTYESTDKDGVTYISRLWGDKDTLLTPKLLLSGHIDVVAADDSMFKPQIDEERMIGRGVGDMKGHVAAEVIAYLRWRKNNPHAKGIGLLLNSDEEVGGFNGARYMVEKEGLRPSVVFIPDGEFNFNIVDSQKAPHHFHVQARSYDGGGHVSRSFKIDNPVNRILSVYKAMREKYAQASKDDEWRSTFEMTVMQTGNGAENRVVNSANGIPEFADAWFGWRFPLEVEIEGEKPTFESGLADLEKIAQEYGVEIIGGHGMGEGCYTDPNASFVKTWKGIIEKTIRHEVGFDHMHGATDGRHFYKYGAEVLVTSAITEGAHSNAEWVDIDSLVKLAEAMYNYQEEMVR